MNKKAIVVSVVCTITCLMLTGCHIKHEWKRATCTEAQTCRIGGETKGDALGHDWQDATCTEPKECSRCEKTKGDALGHDWQDATCTEPKTCKVCGETEGNNLGHNWKDADYWQPKMCDTCGETDGDKLTADFETYGLEINAKVGPTYDYVTHCYDNNSKQTTGKVTFSNYQVQNSNNEYDTPDGYEWRSLHISIVFNDTNAQDYGVSVDYSDENYYDIVTWDSDMSYSGNLGMHTIVYNGEEYDECAYFVDGGFSGWSQDQLSTVFEIDVYFRVPIGYDGAVFELKDSANSWYTGAHIYDVADDNTLFFRLN